MGEAIAKPRLPMAFLGRTEEREFIYFNTVQVISRWVVGRAEETSTQFVRALYCKLPTKGKQLPAFPLEAMTGIEPRPQRLEARVLPLCHRGPLKKDKVDLHLGLIKDDK